jgi:hypothetical protein
MSGEISYATGGLISSNADAMWAETVYDAQAVALPLIDPPVTVFDGGYSAPIFVVRFNPWRY